MWYGTPSHGGLSVTRKWALDNLTLQAQYLAMYWGGKLWFEEDCKCALVFHEHPELYQRMFGSGTAVPMDVRKSVECWDPDYFAPDFIEACRVAGDVPDLLFLQPGDRILISGHAITFKVLDEWIGRGSGRSRVIQFQDGQRLYHSYKLTTADVQERLLSIEREGAVVWTRPAERPWDVKQQASNG